jgi:Spy/CpxP family protein refolding chaperone
MVMRILSAVLTLLVALSSVPRLSADEPSPDSTSVGQGLVEKMHDLNLTEEQTSKLADIHKECSPKVEAAGKELAAIIKEEVEKVRGVLTPDQLEKLQAMKDERKEHRTEGLAQRMAHLKQLKDLDLTDAELTKIGEIRNDCRPKIASALKGLENILTDEQKKAREEGLKAGKSHREVRESLNLTDEQKQKVQAIGKEVCGIVHEEMTQIKAVLTPEQQEKLTELKDERMDRIRDRLAARIANFESLNLTDEQKTKITDVRNEFRPKVQEAGDKLRAAIRDELDMTIGVIRS